ncbi:MAG: hypothetical protein UV73_C0012G0047 [Candidatus Gottesmanbacteria bacterium GW2011_GWA2_43_14]|uniref:Large ribosomal subunit protein uL29 n=1 Tax=Candidatus Gottesmanbacteria bacterium GW2011_GWA2_43_14 TaxID=1618443 RepID=A0A0G1DEG4_9BACT|nr:MAG: hypothetical protein UV73_C0012G0047 [Candidatus Gottesmanbacteria bacterium GW2011_GWA2_43_14]
MKRTQIKELANKTLKTLGKEVADLQSQFKKKTVEASTGKIKNVSWKRDMKKDIARLKTVIRMKEMADK